MFSLPFYLIRRRGTVHVTIPFDFPLDLWSDCIISPEDVSTRIRLNTFLKGPSMFTFPGRHTPRLVCVPTSRQVSLTSGPTSIPRPLPLSGMVPLGVWFLKPGNFLRSFKFDLCRSFYITFTHSLPYLLPIL